MPVKKVSYKVKANEFDFDITEEQFNAVDIIEKSPGEFNLLVKNRSANAKIIESTENDKKLIVEVEGEIFTITIKDELDQMLDIMGFGLATHKHIKEIRAPMPGMVLQINVSEGQQVKAGDKILILEAMKMENSILIQADATIKRIAITRGQAVEKGQVLVELD
jgi:biotin carboxyl carrier protein